ILETCPSCSACNRVGGNSVRHFLRKASGPERVSVLLRERERIDQHVEDMVTAAYERVLGLTA
ncbi:hypothetical protein, partial [Brachybacterium alimentarium]|uniref:hypothetical protein n=1 Tax=Brachybacterium alimentarium TaxID=47845 RepID=UPI001C6A005C